MSYFSKIDIKSPLSSFGDLRTIELTPVFQYSFEYTIGNTRLNTNTVTGSGSVSQANAMASCATGTTTSSKAILTSDSHAKYRAGLGGLLRFSALFTTGVASTSQWVGLLDEQGSSADFKNGYAIGYNGTSFCIARFQNDVLFSVSQASFDDKLDGTGASGITIDPTKLNIFQINFQYLGSGAISFFVEKSSTGEMVKFHTIQYANLNTSPSVYNPNFHYVMYANNKSTTSNLSVKTGSYGYFIEGKSDLSEIHQPQFNSGSIQKTSVTTEVPILTIRNKATYASKTNFVDILMERFTIGLDAASASNLATCRLVKNMNLTGASFSDISSSDSVVELDTSATSATGGSLFIVTQLAGKNDRFAENLVLYKQLIRPGESLSILCSATSSSTFNGACLWKELF